MEPRPVSVVTVGTFPSSESSTITSEAPERMAPPPTYRTGRAAVAMSRAASRTWRALGLTTGWYPGRSVSGGHTKSASSTCADFVTSTSTGPGLPVEARWNASAMRAGISSALVTRKECLVTGIVMPTMSAS